MSAGPSSSVKRHASSALAAVVACAWAFGRLKWLVIVPTLLIAALSAALMLVLLLSWTVDSRRSRQQQSSTRSTRATAKSTTTLCPGSLPSPLTFTSAAAWSAVKVRAGWEASPDNKPKFEWATDELNEAIKSLLDLVIKQFVQKWYSGISDSPAFPSAVDATLRHVLNKVAQRASSTEWIELLVGRILPIVTAHAENFRAAEQALRGQRLKTHLTESSELDLFLASRYAAETAKKQLHPSVNIASPNSKPAEEAWLRSFVAGLLPCLLPSNELDSPVVATLVQEIVACTVISAVVESLSDPDFWNRFIDDKAGSAIRDKRMVEQFREALNRQGAALSQLPLALVQYKAAATTTTKRNHPHVSSEISAKSDPREVEAWIRDVRKVKTLAEARRLRSDITTRIRRTRSKVDQLDAEDTVDGIKVKSWLAFVERLDVARQMADRRISELGGADPSRSTVKVSDSTKRQTVSLRDILTAPGPLSYFMEFQDRRKRSLWVQFWLLIEGIKDPLDLVDLNTAKSTLYSSTFNDDIKMIWDTYLASNTIHLDSRYVDAVREYLDKSRSGEDVSSQTDKLRKTIFAAQQDVYAELEQMDFTAFRQTDLYLKAVAELPSSLDEVEGAASVRRSPQANVKADQSSPTIVKPSQLQRVETAPPHLTTQALFEDPRPKAQRTASDGQLSAEATIRKVSGGSLDSLSSSIASLSDRHAKRRPTLSDSLDFLMAAPDVEDPLFQEADETYPTYRAEGPALDEAETVQTHTFEAIQEALNTILATDDKRTEVGDEQQQQQQQEQRVKAERLIGDVRPPKPSSGYSGELPPNRAPGQTHRLKDMFDDDVPVDDEMEDSESEGETAFDLKTIHLAAPGDLNLPSEIERLSKEIDRLNQQEAVVGAMVRKAELTGNVKELKVLVKSQESLRRELRALSFQKAQYESQETENKLTPGRTRVSISGTTVGQSNGQSFQLYLVEVHQLQVDGAFGSGWIVTRRYSEFATLHAKLKDRFSSVRSLEFPSKRLVTSYSRDFVEARRQGLERYLQKLVLDPVICSSQELRSFLSQQNITLPNFEDSAAKQSASLFPGQSLMRSLLRTVTSGVDDIIGVSATSIVDTVISRLSTETGSADIQDEDLFVAATTLTTTNPTASQPQEGLTYFTAPICDLFITLFQLKDKNQWLRRQAILIILQQVLGGTIERKFREAVRLLTSQAQLVNMIESLKSNMWPDGQPKPKEPPRTVEQRTATKDAAFRKLMALMPDVAASFIGRSNAKHGTRQMFALIQNQRLNKHLMYTVLEEIVVEVFPEIKGRF
ncbi:hypothetical protein ACM66B_001705 [Microbotryomycetes sp. NB124-2]